MHFPVFENAYLLKSIGWAIINSFWQIGSLWLLYQLISASDKKLSAIIKYNLGVVLLFASFSWFIFTFLVNYRMLVNLGGFPKIVSSAWMFEIKAFDNVLPFLAICYLTLLCLYLIPFLKNLSATRFLQQNGLSKAPVDFRVFTTQTALHLGIKRNVHIWMSGQVDVPSVSGFFKPVILLPLAILNHLSVSQVEAIILHELAHIKRNDYLLNLVQTVIELMLFFNPFAVLLSKAVKRERENCCDDWVMNFRYGQYDYAKALVVLEEHRHLTRPGLVLAATNNKKNLLKRVKRMFNLPPQTSFSRTQKLKLVSLMLLLLATIISFSPSISAKQPTSKTTVQRKNIQIPRVIVPNRSMENPAEIVFENTGSKEKVKLIAKKVSKKKRPVAPVIEHEKEYVNAFINEELLNNAPPVEPVISQVGEKETGNSKLIVSVEEEQSGKKPTNTYYFELDNKDGIPAVKPLLILNKFKYKVALKKISMKIPVIKILDSLTAPIAAKKKITS
ncbi:MAG: regulatory sensor-transducer, BlaR1/MecR1 family [Ferruginibacter sp.]|nr:regulatory sensor-transducer, BlaR1/MecR1 family [Ferruginibacter sp.]